MGERRWSRREWAAILLATLLGLSAILLAANAKEVYADFGPSIRGWSFWYWQFAPSVPDHGWPPPPHSPKVTNQAPATLPFR